MLRSIPSSDPEKQVDASGLQVEKPRPVLLLGESKLGLVDQTKNLSDLPVDLVTEVLERLQVYQDFVCATSSCRFWRLIGTKSNNDIFHRANQFPWLMLAEEEGCSLRALYNVRNNKTCYLELPEANGKKKCVSSCGWLVTIDPSLEINLVHPLSRVQFKLPDISTSLDLYRYCYDPITFYDGIVRKAVFSSSPRMTTSESYTLCILFGAGRIGMWRKGDACWSEMDETGPANADIVFYKGLFYGVRCNGSVFSWDTQGTRLQAVAEYIPELENDIYNHHMYLVESGGSLLMVSRLDYTDEDEEENFDIEVYGTYKFKVFDVRRCQSNTSAWRPLSDLDGRSLFLGFNSSFSIHASHFPDCKPNCIYYTDDLEERYFETALGGGKDMGIYHLNDGRFEHFPVKSFNHISPPFWVELLPSS